MNTELEIPRYYRCCWPTSGGDSADFIDELLIDRHDPDGEKDFQVATKAGFELQALYTQVSTTPPPTPTTLPAYPDTLS